MSFLQQRSSRHIHPGFTIVELIMVIIVISILATITIIGYQGVQQRGRLAVMSSDLKDAAGAFELYKYDNGSYPTDMPSNIKTSRGVVLSATNVTGDVFCINAYYPSDPTVKASWDSKKGLQQGALCSGAAIGQAAGGQVPLAARGTNLMSGFSSWTLSGTASYDPSSGELTMGTNGTASSPLVRVDGPTSMKVGGDMYATAASASFTPQGGYHTNIYYYGSDGATPAQNTAGYTSNGCAQAIALNAWQTAVQTCSYTGGPNIVYVSYTFYSSAGGYASSDLKLKNPLLIVN